MTTTEAKELAHNLCLKWWNERKISYNWTPADEELLAKVLAGETNLEAPERDRKEP